MLSRVADSLYWMSRYIERAENIARILDVNLQLLLDLPTLDPKRRNALWEPVLRATGDAFEFYQQYEVATPEHVMEYLILNEKNSNSIQHCINAARENARHVRETISVEMWEELNRVYLDLKHVTMDDIERQTPSEFFKFIKDGSHLFQGITDATMMHGEGWEFIQTGKFLERADKTTRMLDANEEVLLPHEKKGKVREPLMLNAILRSCSAETGYRRTYPGYVESDKVVDFLVLNEFFPRSVRFCVYSLDDSLHRISGAKDEHFTNQAEKLSGRLISEIIYSTVDDILGRGIHDYIDELQMKLNSIGSAMATTYMAYSEEAAASPAADAKPAEAKSASAPATTTLPASNQSQATAAKAVVA
ncbi:alpha-E domain-containing protein [Verrucomicrobia bacterium LW23]|nr:alpha-E domain-containing protein [Verrucomicrobia bacterium LW23]